MLRTICFALFCLVAMGAMIAIKTAMAPAHLAGAVTHNHATIGNAFGPNTTAKSDRLPLPDIREPAETERNSSVAATTQVDMPSNGLGTGEKAIGETAHKTMETVLRKTEHRRWEDSNAALIAPSPRSRRATSTPEKTNTDTASRKTTSHVFQCRQDAFGSLLRSLDLSPHCGPQPTLTGNSTVPGYPTSQKDF